MDKKELIETLEYMKSPDETELLVLPIGFLDKLIAHLDDEPFDVLEAIRNKQDIQCADGAKNVYTIDGNGVYGCGCHELTHEQLAKWNWQRPEPKPELVDGKDYIVRYVTERHIARWLDGKWHCIKNSGETGGAYTAQEYINHIMKDGKPVEVEV